MNDVLFASSGSTDYETPPELFQKYDAIYHFSLDVCANSANKKCRRFYSPKQDGLTQPWSGACWMNPPYGRDVEAWIKKAYESAKAGATVVALLPARTDTAWFHEFVYNKAMVEFLRGRVRFILGDKSGPATFPSMIVIWTPRWSERK
ncbi:DNA N-6-adenine-methyltransferase of bacteriophage [Spirochaetia bacterium]|nr:DNA N-6-adenine-methyltransferase of bacteriophage [Spirochaetia bacterium]